MIFYRNINVKEAFGLFTNKKIVPKYFPGSPEDEENGSTAEPGDKIFLFKDPIVFDTFAFIKVNVDMSSVTPSKMNIFWEEDYFGETEFYKASINEFTVDKEILEKDIDVMFVKSWWFREPDIKPGDMMNKKKMEDYRHKLSSIQSEIGINFYPSDKEMKQFNEFIEWCRQFEPMPFFSFEKHGMEKIQEYAHRTGLSVREW